MRNIGIIVGLGFALAATSQAALIVGFDNAGTTADIQATGFTGTSAVSPASGSQLTFGTVDVEAQSDQSGTYANGDTASIGASWKSTSPSGVSTAFIDFTVSNASGADVDLGAFMFNGVGRKDQAMRDYTVSVLSGSITAGSIQSGTLPRSTSTGTVGSDYGQFLIDLTGLTDSTLDDGTSATFRIFFSGGSSSTQNESYIDNVGVSTFAATHVYEVVEKSFTAQNSYNNAYIDVDLWVDLSGPDGLSYQIPAFWDGGQTFRVRLVATKPGAWSWSTGSSTGDNGLDNKSGSFNAVAWTEAEKVTNPNRRGFIHVASNNHTLEYADGTPFFYAADTWWTALTKIYSWNSSAGLSGISFQDAIALRKAQGFNSINLIASFPSDAINGIWHAETYGEKIAEDGSLPFVITDPEDIDYGVDYTQINPDYWQQADLKWQHMWDNGFAPFMESVRRHEKWYDENTAERNAFVNYTRYLWARYGCYNMLYSWVHADFDDGSLSDWKAMINMTYDALGKPPYGQPVTAMAPGSSLTTLIVDPNAIPVEALDFHNVSNKGRDYTMFGWLRDIYNAIPTLPGINLEPYYPGLVLGANTIAPGLDDNTMAQFLMYGSVLNGGFAGHGWGDNYYAGVDGTDGSPHANGFNRWCADTMGDLKAFILDAGHDYRTLRPATLTNLNAPANGEEFRVLALNNDQSVGLGFFAANNTKLNLINLVADEAYTFQWYNIDTGVWSSAVTLTASGVGKLIIPDKPNDNGWAFRIKSNNLNQNRDPIGRWSLDEGTGTVANDTSGNNYDGTITDGSWVTGIDGNALDFNGSTSSVTLPAAAFSTINNEITIAMWVYGDTTQPRNDSVFYAADSSGNRVLNIHLPWSNSNVYWDAGDSTGYDRIYKTASAADYKGVWNYWVFTKNASTGDMKMYLNGTLWHTGTGKTRTLSGITSATISSSALSYDGVIDDVRLYNLELTAAEVAGLYTVPVSWTELTSDDFEADWGNWLDGGDDARRALVFAIGLRCLALQDDTSTSESELASSLDLTGYTDLKIDFSYVVQSFEDVEDFFVCYSSDGGSTWTTIQAFVNDVDFVDDGTRYFPSITINSGSYTFNNNVKIKFECDASGDADDVYIDDVVISAR